MQMEINIKVILKKVFKTVKEIIFIKMEMFIKEIGKRVKNTVKE